MSEIEFRSGFEQLWGHSPYDFQIQVAERILAGRSVILQAPTGAGKTWAALFPYLFARANDMPFPRKCLYSVPLRVLANQFWADIERRETATDAWHTTVQTGARADDPKFEGDVIFTTIDQTLSSFLNIPYSLSPGQGNLNAGAVISSYLVFDELHLFDPRPTLLTTLHLLRMLKGIVPFLAMTATLSSEMVATLAGILDAEPIVLPADQAAMIPSQQKVRRLQAIDEELTPEAVLRMHHKRSIAICNTVGRAQHLYEGLRDAIPRGTEVRLLHSRFLRRDRDELENWLRREFGKDKGAYMVDSAILVATQAVEVGVDVTSEALHTELAPAASLVQRAGRCARYQGEVGTVSIYRLPLDRNGRPSYAPYLGVEAEISKRTWQAFADSSGERFDFADELAVVDAAHTENDRRLLSEVQANRFFVADQIAHTIATQERGATADLIREVDSRTVFVHPEPTTMGDPWAYEGFGLFRGTLFGAYKALETLADELGEAWVFVTADALLEEESSRELPSWRWRKITNEQELNGALFVVANPRLVSYRSDIGFQLVPGDGTWQSPPRQAQSTPQAYVPYGRETIQEHVARMLRVYEEPLPDGDKTWQRLAPAEEITYAARCIERRFGWSPGLLDRLARLTIVLHDVGKLNQRWQGWAHAWQKEVSVLRKADMTLPDGYLAAHTDYEPQNPAEREMNQRLHTQRPTHAVEGAAAVMSFILEQVKEPALAKAAITAIARHHGAGAAGTYSSFRACVGSSTAVMVMLREAGLDQAGSSKITWQFPAGSISRRLVDTRQERELLPYFLLVRALRLADQRSQELAKGKG